MKITRRRIDRRKYASEVLLRLTHKPEVKTGLKKKSKYKLRESMLKRVSRGALVMKHIENDPDLLKIIVFKDKKNFFLGLDKFFPDVYTKWVNDEDVIIDVNSGLHELSGITEGLLKPVNIFSKRELMDGATNFFERCNAVANSVDTRTKVEALKTSILQVANRIYGSNSIEVEAYVYGSRCSGLAIGNSDVDIYVDIGNTFNGSLCNNIEKQRVIVELFLNALKERTDEFDNVFAFTNYRVPVLRFRHRISNVRGELAFRSGMSVQNSKLVKLYMDLDERVKFVVCGVKHWFAENGLDDRETFPSCAQTWLALYFLAQDWIGLIPTVTTLRNMMPPNEQCLMIENWNCAIPDIDLVRSNWKTECCLSREDLLAKFFAFYSNVPTEGHVLCTYDGLMRTRKQFFRGYQLLKVNSVLNSVVQSDFTGFCLQDPFDRFKNLTMSPMNTNSRKCVEFVEWCRETEALCTETEVSCNKEKKEVIEV